MPALIGHRRPMVQGSYPPGDVTFLLTDLGGMTLEAGLLERERSVREGGHYSERLPIEYRPTGEYLRLFHALLEARAREVATLVGVLAEELLAAVGVDLVIVSLARAGTPVGVLIRRYLSSTYGLQAAHYSVSIIRDRGLDLSALRYILARHRPGAVRFVDGWTGKGVIGRELAAALHDFRVGGGTTLDSDLWVLADPAYSTRRFATRHDILIPSACLNATVSGLVSRTVLDRTIIGPGDFHGAKVYPELSPDDVSQLYVQRVEREFSGAAAGIVAGRTALVAAEPPDERGLREVRTIMTRFGLPDENLVKPGVGETTRVLLRRLPWKVLYRPQDAHAIGHIFLLARDRGVPVVEWPHMSYSCCGLIAPAVTTS